LLRRLGLWHRDRLSVVVGNHDIFHTPHRGSKAHFLWEAKNALSADAQASYEAFNEWAGEVVGARDRLAGGLYPFQKWFGEVRLWATDTTSVTTDKSGNGYWPKGADALLREATRRSRGSERRILAMHNTPFEDDEQTALNLLRGEYSFGFPPEEFARLEKFTDDAQVDAAVCGHVHWTGDGIWNWPIGAAWRCDVHMVGRTGGVHGARPCFGLLEVPEEGRLKWKTVRV
jgi:hypothetical protein